MLEGYKQHFPYMVCCFSPIMRTLCLICRMWQEDGAGGLPGHYKQHGDPTLNGMFDTDSSAIYN